MMSNTLTFVALCFLLAALLLFSLSAFYTIQWLQKDIYVTIAYNISFLMFCCFLIAVFSIVRSREL